MSAVKKAAAAVEKAVKLYHPDFMVFPEVFMSHYPAGTDRSVIQERNGEIEVCG